MNATISTNGGAGTSHYDGSGAGGSGGAIRIEAASILNLGAIYAKGGDSLVDSTLAGAGGGGTHRLLSDGTITAGDTNSSGGNNLSIVHQNYRSSSLVAHWKFDENSSTTTAVNSKGNFALNNYFWNPERRTGKKGGAFYFDGNDDKVPFHTTVLWPLMSTRYRCGIFPEK